jgi:hypothetical protein
VKEFKEISCFEELDVCPVGLAASGAWEFFMEV